MDDSEKEVNLSFIPEAGKPSCIQDGNARAIDGTAWVSSGGIWKHRVIKKPAPDRPKKKEMTAQECRNVLAILHGVFIWLSMTAVFLGPVKLMGADAWGALWGVLAFGAFCGVCAYLVSNHLGKKEYK